MKKTLLAVIFMIAGYIVPTVQAAVVQDQGQIFGTDGLLDLGTDQWAQSITTGIAGQLSGVQLQFDGTGIPSGNPSITMSIFDGGNPVSGIPLFIEVLSLTNGDLDPGNLYLWDTSSAGIIFDIGDVFSLGFQAAATGFIFPGNDGPGYDGGDLFKNGSVFGDGDFDKPRDIGFITFVDPAISAVPVPAAVWLFGTALIGFVGMSRRKKVA